MSGGLGTRIRKGTLVELLAEKTGLGRKSEINGSLHLYFRILNQVAGSYLERVSVEEPTTRA